MAEARRAVEAAKFRKMALDMDLWDLCSCSGTESSEESADEADY